VELGIIKPPKTAEEMAAEQQQAMQDMLAIIKDLKTEVEELKNAKRTSDIKPTERQSSNAK
jgi:type II secretory pathway component PulM